MEVESWLANVAQIGAVPLLSIVVILILRGHLRPKSNVDEIRADRDARLRDKDEQIAMWRAAYQTEADARNALEHQTREALEATRAIEQMIRSLRDLQKD